MKRSNITLFLLFLVTILSPVTSLTTLRAETKQNGTEPFFTINLLLPPYSYVKDFGSIVEASLEQLGVEVNAIPRPWGEMLDRTFLYPVGQEYNYIPTYDEGGYDILLIGWSWDLHWDPTGVYDTTSIIPNGNNVYQYSNPTFDQTLTEYLTALNTTVQLEKVKALQQILYEDLPSITIIYPSSLFGMKEGLTGIDILLFGNSKARYEYWDDPADHNITYAIPFEFFEYNIYVQDCYGSGQWMAAIYGGLFARSQDSYKYEPLIAKNYTISADGKDITVDINPETKFSDGNPVTAEDVKYSYQLYMTPFSSFYGKRYKTLCKFFENNDSIEIVDQDTLIFHLKQPYTFPLDLLSYSIIEKAKVEPLITTYGYDIFYEPPFSENVSDSLVTSCGPFVLKEFDEHKIVLSPNPFFVGSAPKLQHLIFQSVNSKSSCLEMLANGEIDIGDIQYSFRYEELNTLPNIEAIEYNYTDNLEFAINMKHPYLGTGELTPVGTPEAAKKIRQAISHLTPRENIINEVFDGLGYPGVTPMPPSCIGFDSELAPYSYDLTLAKQLIEEAGFTFDNETSTTTSPTSLTNNAFINNYIWLSFIALVIVAIYRRKK
ncbi:MAG: ABC transporter substrate-binding protein [Candidatus Heimdallarchaeaceae archaeon]